MSIVPAENASCDLAVTRPVERRLVRNSSRCNINASLFGITYWFIPNLHPYWFQSKGVTPASPFFFSGFLLKSGVLVDLLCLVGIMKITAFFIQSSSARYDTLDTLTTLSPDSLVDVEVRFACLSLLFHGGHLGIWKRSETC